MKAAITLEYQKVKTVNLWQFVLATDSQKKTYCFPFIISGVVESSNTHLAL
jgi:hypothetical protein